MERALLRYILKSSLLLFLSSPLFCLSWQETCEKIETLKHRQEGTIEEAQLNKIIQDFLVEEQYSVNQLPYTPSSLVHSFSSGFYLKILGSSREKNVYFIFPLDQLASSSATSNNAGLYMILKVLQTIKSKTIVPQRNMYFVFLGAELTRYIPIGSLFFLQSTAFNFKNSLFYYLEISSLKEWHIHTRGQKAYYATPSQQLKDFLYALQILPSLNYKVVDSFPVKNLFQEHDKEPFETYSTLNLPFMQITSPDLGLSLQDLRQDLEDHNWHEFFINVSKSSLSDSPTCTNQYYLYFCILNKFFLIDSSYYLILILVLANLITFTGFRQIRFVNERVKQTLHFSWYFVFLLFLFTLCLGFTSYLFPLIKPFTGKELNTELWLLYVKIAFASFLNFLLLYLAHPTLGNISKQNYLYMSLFFFLTSAAVITFYNILSSFFFLLNAILVFLGIISSPIIRLLSNLATFLWLLFILREGVDDIWLKYFLGSHINANLILSSCLFPYQLLMLSYTTPSQKKETRRFTRSLFSKMHTTLLASFLFSLIVVWSDKGPHPQTIPVLEVEEVRDLNKQTSQYLYNIVDQKQINVQAELLKEIQNDWQQKEPEEAPKNLEDNFTQTQVVWQRTLLFKRQDYQVKLKFPFIVENLDLNLNKQGSFVPLIVYRSNLPYELTQKGSISFRPGPNPPLALNLEFSLDSSDRLSLEMCFTSPIKIKKEPIVIEGQSYQLHWRQKIKQTVYPPFKEPLDKKPELSLSTDPELERLRLLKIPQQQLFP